MPKFEMDSLAERTELKPAVSEGARKLRLVQDQLEEIGGDEIRLASRSFQGQKVRKIRYLFSK